MPKTDAKFFLHTLFARRAGMNLTEIVLGIVILAMAFVPIMNIMGEAIKASRKDDRIKRAMSIAQTKLNAAVQFPFNDIVLNNGGALSTGDSRFFGGTTSWSYATNSGHLNLSLGLEGDYQCSLIIADVNVFFDYQLYDPASHSAFPGTPSGWNWTAFTCPAYSNIFHMYTLIVRWGDLVPDDHFYSLVTFKGRLVQ
ncbi:MAG: hypothetical protein WA705_13955 [Candidatus Ozemobacteraceae bacterium]